MSQRLILQLSLQCFQNLGLANGKIRNLPRRRDRSCSFLMNYGKDATWTGPMDPRTVGSFMAYPDPF